MNIVLLSGSPRKVSQTNRVALHLKDIFTTTTMHKINYIDLRETVLPFIQHVYTSREKAPAEHLALFDIVAAADAFIIVSPEYNGAYSPAMKNFFDHFPKQFRKPFGIVTASTGSMGGMRASQQLLQLVPALGGIASATLLITPHVDQKFTETGVLLDEQFGHSIHRFVQDFLWLAETVTKR